MYDPVSFQPQVPDVDLRRMGAGLGKMIGGVWFPTAAFTVRWVDGRVESIMVTVQGFAKP